MTPFPSTSAPFVDQNGVLTQVWVRFLQGLAGSASGTGEIILSAIAPSGALPCTGGVYLRETYKALWAGAQGFLGAGDGVTTFTVPALSSPHAGLTYYIVT